MTSGKHVYALPSGVTYLGNGRYRARMMKKGRTESVNFHAEPPKARKGSDALRMSRDDEATFYAEVMPDLERKFRDHSDCVGLPLADFVSYYVEERELELNTRKGFRSMVAVIRKYAGSTPAAELRPSQIEKLYGALAKSYAPGTVRGYRSLITSAYRWAVRDDLLDKSPADRVKFKIPDEYVREIPELSWDDLSAMLEMCRDTPLFPFALLTIRLGLRRGESCGLRWRDIRDGYVRVSRSVPNVSPKDFFTKGTKTGRSRTVPLDAATAQELERIRWRQLSDRRAWGDDWKGAADPRDDYVCADSCGMPEYPQRANARWTRAFKDTPYAGATPHHLRHAIASLAGAAGIAPVATAEALGHTVDVHARTYRHATTPETEALRELMERHA